MKEWSDRSKLTPIKNTCDDHEHVMETDELTFHGYPEQPDYATIKITIKPNDLAVDLKSVKKYLFQFRTMHISYERILNTIFEDFKEVFKPKSLEIVLMTNPRGGIRSTLKKKDVWG